MRAARARIGIGLDNAPLPRNTFLGVKPLVPLQGCRVPRQLRGTPGRTAALLLALWFWTWSQPFGEAADPSTQFPAFTPETGREYLRAVVQTAQAAAGDDVDVGYSMARVRSHLGEKDEAERWARLALERKPARADIGAFLADLLIQQDRLEEAARVLQDAVRQDPRLPGGYRRLGMVLDRLGDRAGAEKALEQAVQVAPQDATARLLMGRLLWEQGRLPQAEAALEEACRLDTQLSGAVYLLSQVQSRLGKADAARQSQTRFAELKQKEKQLLDARNTNYDDAAYLRALAAGFHLELGDFCMRRHETACAEAHLRQAIALDPEQPRGLALLASILLRANRAQEARPLCETLVRLQPGEVSSRVNLGTLLLQLNEEAAGEKELKKALELDPRQPQALNNLARLYLRTRRNLPEALALSRRLVEIQPTAASYDLLGFASFSNGHLAEAKAAAAEAVRRDPDNPVYQERQRKLQQPP